MNPFLIDAHAHLDQYADNELPAVIDEIDASQTLTISTAMNPDSYLRARTIADRCRFVLPTFGIHPWEAHDYSGRIERFDDLIEESPMLGEVGLDYHFVQEASRYGPQQEVLEHFLRAARDQGKIVNLHTKGAEARILDLLVRFDIERAIVHWYSGPLDVLVELSRIGCYFTVGVEALRSDHVRQIALMIPEDQLLTETDNPGGWEWLEGERGMPNHLVEVISALADIRDIPEELIESAVHENFALLIQDDPWLTELRSDFF